jgi:hypothetical protein
VNQAILQPRTHGVLDALVALTEDPRPDLEGLARTGTHVWFRDDGQWEHQHPSEGGSMLCGLTSHASPADAWAALFRAGVLDAGFVASPRRAFGPPAGAECMGAGRPCTACAIPCHVTDVPTSFPLVFALGSNPVAVVNAEAALDDLAEALGRPRPASFVWRPLHEGQDDLDLGMLMRLVGADRVPTSRERMVHLHGEAGFHPEWGDHLGFGRTPPSAVEDALIAYREGGLAGIRDEGSPRQRALRALLRTGFAIACDLGLAVATGTLLAAQPFDQRLDDTPWGGFGR